MDPQNENPKVPTSMNDHDLLVVLHTQMQRVLLDLKEVKDNTVGRIAVLESSVVYKKDAEIEAARLVALAKSDAEKLFNTKNDTVDDFETRIRVLEKGQTQIMTWGSALVVAIGILQFAISHFVK